MIGEVHLTTIQCDYCRTEEEHIGKNKAKAIKEFRKRDWLIRKDGTCLCPDCRKEQ